MKYNINYSEEKAREIAFLKDVHELSTQFINTRTRRHTEPRLRDIKAAIANRLAELLTEGVAHETPQEGERRQ